MGDKNLTPFMISILLLIVRYNPNSNPILLKLALEALDY